MQQPQSHNSSALILAGGRGMRMGGADKSALSWQEHTFLDIQYSTLARQSCGVWLNRQPQNETNPSGLPVCLDRLGPDWGPLAGIHAGLLQLARPWLLIVPCDAPFLPPDLLQRLAQPAQSLIRYAHDGERDQYLFALLHSDLARGLGRYLLSGGRAVRFWYRQHRAVAVDCSDIHDCFANINTPDDYQRLQSRLND